MELLKLDVNAHIELTAKLEKLHKSAFPSAVRNTLNNAAFETRKIMPDTAKKKFITRNNSFIKSITRVNKASGFDINKMKSETGLIHSRNPKITKNMASHEKGGNINGRKLFAHDNARTSKSNKKQVRRPNYINKLNIHNSNRAYRGRKGNRGTKFAAAVFSAMKANKKYFQIDSGGKGTVYEVLSASSRKSTRGINFKLRKLYNYRRSNNFGVKRSNFISDTALMVSKNIPEMYRKNAEFQFKKHLI